MHFGNISDRIMEALINGGYQGLLLIGCTALIVKALPGSNAATRHAILFVALLISASLPVLHFTFPARVGASVVSLGTSTQKTETPESVVHEANTDVEPVSQRMVEVASDPLESATSDQTSNQPAYQNFWIIESSVNEFSSAIPEATLQSNLATPPSPTQETVAAVKPMKEWLGKIIAFIKASLPGSKTVSLAVLMVLFAAALGRSIKLGFQYLQLRRLKEVAASASERSITLFEELKGELGITRKARLLVHGAISSPIAMGFRKPAVVLPKEMEATATEQQLEQLLRHELAHLKRFDDWTNLVQQLIKEIYCFHPGILWLSRRLTIEREIACDDQVLAAEEGRKTYALFLTEFATRRTSREWAAAQAAWSNRSQLKERIDMILDSKRNATPAIARTRTIATAAFAALIAVLALTSAPRLAFAQATPAAETEATKNEAATLTPQNKTVEVKEDVLIHVEPDDLKEEELILERPGEKGENKVILRAPKKVQRIERRLAIPAQGIPGYAPLPTPALAPVQQTTPAPAPSAMPAGKTDVDERLARLEKMMEQLLAKESGKKEKDVLFRFEDSGSGLREMHVRPFDEEKVREEVHRAVRDGKQVQDLAKIRRSEKDQATTIERKMMSAAAEKEALRAHKQSLQQQLSAIQARLDSLEQKENAEKQASQAKEESLKAAKKKAEKKNKDAETEAEKDEGKSADPSAERF